MPINRTPEPITEDADYIRAMLDDADLPALLVTLAQITGDLTLLREDLRPPMNPMSAGIDPQGGMSQEAQAKAKKVALEALLRFRDGGCLVAADPDHQKLRQLMEFITGNVSEDYIPLLRHEIGIPVETGAPTWQKDDLAPDTDFTVVIVGAGMSGLAAAHRLAQAGVDFVVIEKNEDVGGTWLENSYPGCRLDTPNFAYSYSFAQKDDWPDQFSTRDAIHRYFRDVAEDFSIRPRVRFGTEVISASFDDEGRNWTLRMRGPDGTEESAQAHAVITAVGQLNRPNYPEITGRECFAGRSFHTATWDHEVPLTDQRVAVIGTGASAYQVVPSIADDVGELRVFQRHAPWLLPTPNYHDEIPDGLQWLFRYVPYYHRWYRFYQFWIAVEGRMPLVEVDPGWSSEGTVSPANADLRRQLVALLESQFSDRPDLLEKVVPTYPPGAKRMLRDNGVWAETLKKSHVQLVTDGIEEITERGIRTSDGVEHEVDVIIYGTGFQASNFLTPMTITGSEGVDLHEHWDGDARAYLGITVPGFPNLFCLYGPNTNLVVNGSITLFSECAVHYALECIRTLLTKGHAAMDCRPEQLDAYNRQIDEGNSRMAWGASNVSSWYKNQAGRVTQNWPFKLVDYWRLTREPDLHDYTFL